MRALTCLSAVALFAVAACSPQAVPTSRPLGVVNIKDTTDGAGGYKTRPTAVFWEASNLVGGLPNSALVPDSCIDTLYFPPDTTTAHLSFQLDAGSPINVQTDLTTGTMTPDTIPGVLITYRNHTGGIAYTPGADIIFTIPGAAGGFEAGAIHALTAKRLILGPIDPNPPDSLRLTWLSSNTPGAAVNIQLIYESNGSLVFNRQIICSMLDDGDFWVNRNIAAKWKAAFLTQQKASAFRWVTTFVPLANDGLLESIAEFDTTKTTFP